MPAARADREGGGLNLDRERICTLVRQNDAVSRQELFEAFYGRTYAVAFNILRSREKAEDIVQDTFIKAFNSIDQLRDEVKFGAWLAVIASNLARNFLKREKKVMFTDDDDLLHSGSEGSDTERSAMHRLEVEQVRQAVKKLPPEQYQVIVLLYYHDLKIEEIARMLSLKPGTVKSRLHRARRKLANFLQPDHDPACL